MVEQRHVIQELDNREVDIFYSHQVSKWLNISAESTKELLDGLVNNAFLHRIERGKYCRHNFRDEYVISNYLVEDGPVSFRINWHNDLRDINLISFTATLFK